MDKDRLERLLRQLRSWSKAYPEDVFIPFTEEERKEHSLIITRASGAMGRHMAKFTDEAADYIEQQQRALEHYANREAWHSFVPDSLSGECWQFDWDGNLADYPWEIAQTALTKKQKAES